MVKSKKKIPQQPKSEIQCQQKFEISNKLYLVVLFIADLLYSYYLDVSYKITIFVTGNIIVLSLTTKMKAFCDMSNFATKTDITQLNSNICDLMKETKKDNDMLISQLANIPKNKDIEELHKRIDQQYANIPKNKDIEKLHKRIDKLCANIKNGMGYNFEKYNITLIKRFLGNDLQIDYFHAIDDYEHIVNPTTNQFEIDIYCVNPFIIGECTTYLNQEELDKVKKLIRVKEYFGKKNHNISSCQMYFFTYEIAPEIKDEVVNFCKENNIQLITSNI